MTVAEPTPTPLSGIRVLDIGRHVAGPLCARLLARLGADVIKVEPPGRGDPVRSRGPFRPGAARGESGALHLYVDEAKRGITLNLRCASGRDLFLRLVRESDAVIENFEPRVLRELNLEYEALRQSRRDVVLSSLSNFGAAGPYRDYSGSELTVFAMGGHVYRTGVEGRPPLRMPGHPAQVLAALTAACATLIALWFVRQSGRGQQVEISIFEGLVTSHLQALVESSYFREEPLELQPRTGGALSGQPTRDGLAIVFAQEQQMTRLAELVGAPPELGLPNPMERGASRAALQEHVTTWMRERTSREVYDQAQAARVPASYAASPADLMESPQYRHRNFIKAVDHSEAGEVAVPGLPFQWPGAEVPARPAPRLGEHNSDVYRSLLGLSSQDLVRLAGVGAI